MSHLLETHTLNHLKCQISLKSQPTVYLRGWGLQVVIYTNTHTKHDLFTQQMYNFNF